MPRARRRGLRLLRPAAGRVAGNTARSAAPRIHRRTRQPRATRAMKKRVLFIHGGGEGAYEEDRKLAPSLQDALGAAYDVRCPQMPDEDRPEYAAWRDRISRTRRAERRGDPRWTLFGRFDPFEVPLRRRGSEARCGAIPRRGTLLGRRGLGGRRVRAARRLRIAATPWANGVLVSQPR